LVTLLRTVSQSRVFLEITEDGLGLVTQVDLFEAGSFDEVEQVTFVEVEHGARLLRLARGVGGFDLLREVGYRRYVGAPEEVPWFRVGKAVDRLEDREPFTGVEDAVELFEGAPPILDVDEYRAGSDRGDRGVLDDGKIVGRCAHELGPVEHAHLLRQSAAVVEQTPGDVAEDDASHFADELEGAEGYKSAAHPDVERGFAARERGVTEPPVAHGSEEVQRGLEGPGVSAVAPLQ
jgi:hypothetical protein